MDFNNIVLILAILASANAVKKTFEGYKVYKVVPSSEEHVKVLKDVQRLGLGEFWEETIVVKQPIRIMMSKEKQEAFVGQMNTAGISVEEAIADVQKVINDQLRTAVPSSRFGNENFHGMTWDRYHTLDEIYTWLDFLDTSYSNVLNTVVWGMSNENRQLKGVVIDFNRNREDKVIGVIEGTVHAREWIVPATLTWIIKEFLSSTNADIRDLARNIQWHILPVANPDGYAYSFTNHRMWRKNRNTSYNRTCGVNTDDDMSNGVDLNRNFQFQWNTIGASSNPCSNTFAGSSPASEPETRSIVEYVTRVNNTGNFVYYLAFHSFTQLIVVPYSHITDRNDVLQVSNFANMFEIGIRGASKLTERFGTEYRVGISAEVMYPMSGTSFDWVKNATDVPVCYLLELRDLGNYGFLLPPEQIIPNNLEIMDFLLEIDEHTRFLNYYTRSGAVSSFVYSLGLVVFGLIAALFT